MKKFIFLITLLACGLIPYAKPIVVDLQSMKETSKAVSTDPTISIEEFGDTVRLSFSMRYLALNTNEEGMTEFQILYDEEPNSAVYLDIKKGIYYEKPYDYKEFHNRKSFYEDQNGDIVYEIDEAVIKGDKWNKQYWSLPNSSVISQIVVPAIPYVTLLIDKNVNSDLNNLYIADSEFKDFKNCFCMWTGEALDPSMDVVFNPDRPAKFKGYWPEKPIVEISEDDENHLKLQFTPIQYSDENRTYRVHHKIIFKRGLQPSGVDLHIPDESDIQYFGVDGIPVKYPRKGCIYLKREGSKISKVIF